MSSILRRRTLSTGAQINLVVLAVVTIGFLVAGWIAVDISNSEQLRLIDTNLRETADASDGLLQTLTADQATLLAQVPSAVQLGVVDLEGRPMDDPLLGDIDDIPDLTSLGPNQLLTSVGRPFTHDDGSGPTRVLLQMSDDGYAIASTSLAAVRAAEDRLATQLTIVGVALLVTVALLIWGATGTVLGPLRTMIANAERIRAGDSDVKLDLGHGASEVRVLGTTLDGMRTTLQADEARVRRFAADASHDLRTPLSVINGHVQLHRAGVPHDNAWEEIEREADHMKMLIDDLLLLAQLDQGDHRRGLVDLGELASDAVAAARHIDPARRYTMEPPTSPVLVDGDETQLRRLVDNLLVNVRQHTRTGTAATVTVGHDDHRAQLSVVDDGPGLTDEDLAVAKERFWRSETSRTSRGSGLGLAIADEIANAHAGSIELAAAAPHGLAATLTLPTATRR